MKEKIINTLIVLLRTQGLKFTMDDIVATLRISKSTLYKLFKSREALLEAMVDYILKKLDEEESAVLHSDAPLEHKLIATVKVYSRDLGVFQNHVYQHLYNIPVIREKVMAYNHQRFAHFSKLLDEGMQQGRIRKGIHKDLFFELLLLAQRGLLDPKTLARLNLTYGDATDQSLHILLHGILDIREN